MKRIAVTANFAYLRARRPTASLIASLSWPRHMGGGLMGRGAEVTRSGLLGTPDLVYSSDHM
jgi:hypothetical protein